MAHFLRTTVGLAVSFAVSGLASVGPPQMPKPYRITAVRAQLYYETLNKFSGDILSAKNFSLWNVIIGEGSAEGPASNVLVTVEVSGERGGYSQGKRQILLKATEGNKTIVSRLSEIGILSAKGKIYVPFWLYKVGVLPVRLEATLLGQGTKQTVVKTIPFEGGE
jgi:hypothetical protein